MRGLQLTNVTLAAIQKYPFVRHALSDKFGAYLSDRPHLQRCRDALVGSAWESDRTQTLEASVMDLADDVAYAVHDLEDFCGAGVIDLRAPEADLEQATNEYNKLDQMKQLVDSPSSDAFTAAAKGLAEKHSDLYDDARFRDSLRWTLELIRYQLPTLIGTPSPEDRVLLRAALSAVIADLFQDIDVTSHKPGSASPHVRLRPESWHNLQALKVVTRGFLVATPRMGLIQRAQTEAIRRLYQGLVGWLESAPKVDNLPMELVDYIERGGEGIPSPVDPKDRSRGTEPLRAGHYRAVADYICGMSDAEALLRSQWIAGNDVPGMGALGVPL